MNRFEIIQTVNYVIDKEMTVVRLAFDIPWIGGEKFQLSSTTLVSCLLLFAFVYITCGRLHWDRMVAHDRAFDLAAGTSDSEACPLVNGIGWQAKFVRACFIAAWPGWLAVGWLCSAISFTTERLHRSKAF